MPSNSSGRIAKVRKNKNLTPHQKNHRWESFSTKISKFSSLQPLRKVRRHDLETEDLSTSTSYFQTGLQKWGELNVSKPFSAFKTKVYPLCESLPQLLHFEQRIMDLLADFISGQDKEALEPLLDLLTAFSHDLGVRFEKHYGRSLDLMVAIAAKPQPVEVIEWTFGSLAFLFKYLSKLLVPDLRPTFKVMAPLLGKSRHPPHIARFAAEALSFLVKKAAAPSHRETALKRLVECARDDLISIKSDRQFTLYKDGLMTMFAEAIKGTDNIIHSTGPTIFAALVDAIPEEERSLAEETIWTDVVCGVLTSVIHHATVDTFGEFAEGVHQSVQANMERVSAADRQWQAIPLLRIYGTLAGVRKGYRLSDWAPLIRNFVEMLSNITKAALEVPKDAESVVWKSVIVNIAIVWHHAPIDALIPHIVSLTQSLSREPFMKWFIPFCSYFCELDAQRFGSLFRNDFQKFIANHWSEGPNEDMLCVLLPKMIENRAFPPAGEKDSCRMPQAWQDQIVSKFERLEISPFPERGPYNKDPQVWRDRCLPKYSALLRILELTTVHPSTNARIAELLLRKLKLALRPSSSLASDEVHFIVGQGFHAYLRMSKAAGSVDIALSPLLRAAVPRFAQSIGFLHAYLAYEEILRSKETTERQSSTSSESSTSEEDPVIKSLVENLSSPSHEIRLASLELLKTLNPVADAFNSVDTMIEVEQTPLGLAHTRTIAMHLRKLGQNYASFEDKSWLQQAVPSFLYGMLTVKLSPVWDDSVETMKQIAQTKAGEEAVCEVAFRWLKVPSARWGPSQSETHSSGPTFVSDFECTAVRRLEEVADEVEEAIERPDDLMLQSFDEKQRTAEVAAGNSRSRALKVFNAIPAIAERRSRHLVPHFLAWAGDDDRTPDSADEQDTSEGATWSLADRKAMVGVFSQFINPRVLYQHEEVYAALLQLMENGDVEVQKVTLKAILAWKQEAIKTYQENLEFLLDEARFKNELTVFLQDDTAIKSEHRAELMPVLLRLLYGRTISKKGAASGRHGLHATRLAVLRNLSVEDMGSFLDIATGKLKDVMVVGASKKIFDEPLLPVRKQMGFLNMISSVISELGNNATPYVETLLNAVLYCLVFACRQLSGHGADPENPLDEEEEEKASTHSLLRVIRSTGLKCLNALFQNAQSFQWAPYQDIIIEEVVVPRLDNLPIETTQGVSGMLQLFSTWSVLPRVALFLAPHDKVLPDGVLPKVIETLSTKGKDEVKIHVLAIIRNLVKLATAPAQESEYNEVIKAELLDTNAAAILAQITTVLDMSGLSNDLLEACVETILSLAPIVQDPQDIQSVIKISIFLLNQPPRRVSPKLKGRILLIVEQYVTRSNAVEDRSLLDDVYDTVSSLYSYFKDQENRQSLSRALLALAGKDNDLVEVAGLCEALNSFKEGRIEEPDYDKRLAAFSAISGDREVPLTPKQWLPLLHNLIFHIRDDEEFGILSSNSADGIRRFIRDVAACTVDASKEKFDAYLRDVILPALYVGAREPSDTARREYLRVMGHLIMTMPEWEPIADLSALLNDRTEETAEPTFFFNILSPATSRQLEALQILEAANSQKEMGSQNLAQFFIPLLEHFIFGRTDGSDDHGLGAQATNTIGNLAKSLHWKHYRTTFQRYIGYVESKPDLQKQTIRLLGKFSDALIAASEEVPEERMEVDQVDASSSTSTRLPLTIPKAEKLHAEVENSFLPTLIKHLHLKDESEVSYRVPVGVVIIRLLKLLPSEQMDQKLAGVLTDISHILRSKSVEARDMARDTLVKIAVNLGPSFFGFILRELRGALTRGYQLHVLSYTMHSILVAVIPGYSPGDLDYCLPTIVTVIMDDIFGVIGQEKDAEGYTSQTKEIKSSKSQDSMELVAKNASISQLIELVRPLRALLMQKVDLKMIRKIDALMTRITAGLLQNPAAESRDTLVFCYEVIQDVYNSQKPEVEEKIDPRVKKYLVQKGAKKSGERGRTTKNTYKLIRFAVDILRAILKKHDSLRNAANISGFVPILGDAFVGGEDEVKISAFRLLAVIVKVPFPDDQADKLYKVAVKEATKGISMAVSTTTDLSQAALKMLAVVLRDRRDVPVKDAAIDMLLAKLKDDLTEPLYRHVTFNFLRSVLDRHIETAAIYDTMDYVGTVMITNDDKDTRDLARGAFFQFIREYPQKKARWAKQLNFIVANLKYDREGGRLSVMEIVHLLLMKSSDDFVQEVAATCFLPLFFVLANDDSEKCRLAAGELLKEIFRKADKERTQTFLGLLRSWLDKDGNEAVIKLALQVFGYYLEAHENASKNKKDFKLVISKVNGVIEAEDIREVDGELLEAALGVVRASMTVFPDKILASNSEDMWANIAKCLSHPDTPVKVASIGLISSFLADFAQKAGSTPIGESVEGSYGLELDLAKVQDLVRQALGVLATRDVDEKLGAEAVQVLVFLTPRLPVRPPVEEEEESESEEQAVEEEDADEVEEKQRKTDLQHLFWKLSHIIRREIPPRAVAITPKVAAMEVLETVCRRSPLDRLQPSLKAILVPLHNLTDPSIAPPFSNDELFKTKHEGLKTRAQILMDALQKKFGTAEYTKQLLAIREEVRAKREQRSSKRKIEALAHPEKYGRDKRKKFEKNKERKKTRSKEQKVMRQSYKRW
ncbi:DRIM domain-containing protein [Fusarium falciforme]|uniref:DRIM domain-containing protein n=1 Tax=Fusarium falciforme TaxID=195108 RepID=UPI0023009F20|nr:DRIM domain-containing protein [Fusarium falciforme]WAO83743.1 DRIM domain-containing protein [Fusarium falciforme]